jgi:dipeptidyl aminopeptidase/acylaminoacyl peptidase
MNKSSALHFAYTLVGLAKPFAVGIVITLVVPVHQASTQSMQSGPGTVPIVSAIDAPPGTETLAVEWMKVTVPSLGVLQVAVARPQGNGPFPTLLLLHGSHGFAQEYVRLAQDLAAGGVMAVAACWFRGSAGSGTRFVTPIDCPEAPPLPGPLSPEALQVLDTLVQTTRTLPGARPDRIALFGHSRGGGPIMKYILRGGDVQAAVLNSAGYPNDLSTDVKVPVLILHGSADSPADGGVAVTNVLMARDFEAKLRAAGKLVEAVYYEGGRHNDLFSNPTQYRDELQQMLAFLRRYLRD